MLVQLPNGKTVNMSIEAYLALDEADIQYMVSINCGSTASSPWCGSAVKKPGKFRMSDEDEDPTELEGLDEDDRDLDDIPEQEFPLEDPEAPEPEN